MTADIRDEPGAGDCHACNGTGREEREITLAELHDLLCPPPTATGPPLDTPLGPKPPNRTTGRPGDETRA